ncbi:MAG: EamA family transporter [Arcobacter sp.]|jgi:drug/metabolite transporter (DMT)-like permease|uniref:EamA family transporter n=1 Tax=Arcobacter sp. TaxID=1872629 RepID=UPI002A7530D8|nr:EamA family transporter [Arcobacter sp.]MDY3205722.1 EamA family transporter [Arcobacter sp.]
MLQAENVNTKNKVEKRQNGINMTAYIFIGLTILFTVCGQLLVKSASFEFGPFPKDLSMLIQFLIRAFTNVKLLAGLFSAVIASIMWMSALSLTDISFAYPFMGLAIVLVLALSPLVFKEIVPWTRWLGVAVVCLGLWIASR